MRTRRWQRLLPSISGTPTASKSSLTLSWSEMTTLTSLKIWCKPLFLKLWCENITYAFILLLLCLLVSDDGVLCQNLWRNVCKSTIWIRYFWSLCVLTPDSDQETQWVVSSLETSTTNLGIKISLQKTMLSIIKRTNRFCTNRSRLPLFSKRFIHAGASVYIHWPYCSKLCSYCNFNKYVKDKVDQTR